jgi:hypothetical protein
VDPRCLPAVVRRVGWVFDPVTATNPKSLSGRTSDRANMLGRVLRPASRGRGRSRKARGPRNLARLVAADTDCARCSTVFWADFCASVVSTRAGLPRGFRNGPQLNVRVVARQMTPRKQPLKSFRGMSLGDQEGLGQWLRRRLLQAFASHAACQRKEEGYDKTNYCPRMSL